MKTAEQIAQDAASAAVKDALAPVLSALQTLQKQNDELTHEVASLKGDFREFAGLDAAAPAPAPAAPAADAPVTQ